jgi:hypothetical protein
MADKVTLETVILVNYLLGTNDVVRDNMSGLGDVWSYNATNCYVKNVDDVIGCEEFWSAKVSYLDEMVDTYDGIKLEFEATDDSLDFKMWVGKIYLEGTI